MENIKALYIKGKPITTPLGDIRFITIGEYEDFMRYSPYLNIQKFEIINKFKQHGDKRYHVFAEILDKLPLIDVIKETKKIVEVYDVLNLIFDMCFETEGVFDLINTDEELEYYLNLIREMNCVEEDKKNPNPEIEYFNQLKKMYNKNKGGGITFEAIYTSLWLYLKSNPDNLTIYQFYALFNRLLQDKNYETLTLYNSVSGKIKVEPWYKHIDMFTKEETTLEDFSKNVSGIM